MVVGWARRRTCGGMGTTPGERRDWSWPRCPHLHRSVPSTDRPSRGGGVGARRGWGYDVRSRVEHRVDARQDRAPQCPRVRVGVQPFQTLARGRLEGVGREQAGERRLGVIPASPDPGAVVGFLDEMQDRLEEVVVDPHLVVEGVQRRALLGRVEAGLAEVRPDQRVVLLFDEAIVVLLVGPRTREVEPGDLLTPDPHQMVVQKLRPIVGMELFDREWQSRQDLPGADLHRALAPAQDRQPVATSIIWNVWTNSPLLLGPL